MKIGIEAQRIFRSNKHGMDYVVLQEVLQLQKIDKENEYFVFVKPGPDRCVQSSDNVHVVEIGTPSYPLWEQWALPRAARRANVDLLHCTSNTAPLRCPVPLVLTLHDIIFLEPRTGQGYSLYQSLGWQYRRLVVPRILSQCRRIITVSGFEKRNIMSRLGIEEERMAMIYNGFNDWFRPLGANASGRLNSGVPTLGGVESYSERLKNYIAEPGFIFFLGNTDPKKNTERTLVAYARYLKQSQVKRPLLMADFDRNYLDGIIARNNIGFIRDHLVMPGYIPNSDLPVIYNAAFAFLYTSLRESFGIPLLEAMACGTPVVTSSTSSMPEIGGDAALFANPEDSNDIASQMLRLEASPELIQEKREAGIKRASHFSWEKTATQLLKLYKETTNNS